MAFESLRAAFARLLADVRFALGTALGAVAVGALLGALAPLPDGPVIPQTAPWANRFVAVAELALFGWLAGLLWGVVVAGWSRRVAERSRSRVRNRAALLAGGAALAAAAAVSLAERPLAWAAAAAAVAATGTVVAVFATVRERA
jgi:hypothetical protein